MADLQSYIVVELRFKPGSLIHGSGGTHLGTPTPATSGTHNLLIRLVALVRRQRVSVGSPCPLWKCPHWWTFLVEHKPNLGLKSWQWHIIHLSVYNVMQHRGRSYSCSEQQLHLSILDAFVHSLLHQPPPTLPVHQGSGSLVQFALLQSSVSPQSHAQAIVSSSLFPPSSSFLLSFSHSSCV